MSRFKTGERVKLNNEYPKYGGSVGKLVGRRKFGKDWLLSLTTTNLAVNECNLEKQKKKFTKTKEAV